MKCCIAPFLLLGHLLAFAACGFSPASAGFTEHDNRETPNNTERVLAREETDLDSFDFTAFSNVELIHADISAMNREQLAVLYQQARYCQAMTEADTDTLREIVAEDTVFTHMSGRQQSREEYFADIESGALNYFTIGIDSPVVEVDGDSASITYTSVLNANAYGARGTYRMGGTHWFELRDGDWISVNRPE